MSSRHPRDSHRLRLANSPGSPENPQGREQAVEQLQSIAGDQQKAVTERKALVITARETATTATGTLDVAKDTAQAQLNAVEAARQTVELASVGENQGGAVKMAADTELQNAFRELGAELG